MLNLRPPSPSSLPRAKGRRAPPRCRRRRHRRIGDREVCDQIQRLIVDERPRAGGHRLPKDHRADPSQAKSPRFGSNPLPFQLKVETNPKSHASMSERRFGGEFYSSISSYHIPAGQRGRLKYLGADRAEESYFILFGGRFGTWANTK